MRKTLGLDIFIAAMFTVYAIGWLLNMVIAALVVIESLSHAQQYWLPKAGMEIMRPTVGFGHSERGSSRLHGQNPT